MQAPEKPVDERDRLQALYEAGLLDQPPEERFDRLTRLARQVFGVETVLVSLVDDERQWFMSRQGLDATETPRDISFCGHAINQSDAFIIENALLDPRFADNPLVTDAPFIRFYAGQPLRTPSGHRIGTLCLIDPAPRALDGRERAMLRDFGASVEEVMVERMIEQASERRAVFLSATLDSMRDGLLCVDGERRILMANAAASQLLGKALQDLQRQPLEDVIEDTQLLFSERRLERELRVSEDGELPLEFSVTDLIGGKQGESLVLIRDLTQQKRLAAMQRQFVSTVSHELRTPLTSLRGALDLIVGRFGADLPAKHAHLLDMASRNTQRLTRLINDLLDLEKMQSGELSLHVQDVDVLSIVRQAVEEFETGSAAAGVEIRIDAADELPLVRGDHDRLVQVVGNLLSNALKQSKAGQVITVELRSTGSGARVSVCDRGQGITAEFQGRVFQRFAQADGSDSRLKGGTGLGLSICKAIVEALDGAISFQSEPGVMTRFSVDLRSRQQLAHRADATALVVEDNADVAEVFSELLAQEGLPTDRAASAEEALELLDSNTYRLMLLDLVLPGMDGLQLLHRLAEMPRHRSMRVIVTSARAEESRAATPAIGSGVIDWLPKPVTASRMAASVERALASVDARRVLHVEDEPDVQQVVQMTIGEEFEYFSADTLEKGREKLLSEVFDLLILDVGLPDGSGEALLELVPDGFPVILYSGSEVTGELASLITAQLTKGESGPQQLLQVVRGVLQETSSDD